MTDFAGINLTGSKGEEGASHPAREQLLLALDGELSESESATLKTHLEACWKCRARVAELEAAITEFSRFDDAVLTACLPPPPNGWRGFDGRLRQLAQANGTPSWRARWRGWWARTLAGFSILRWATTLVLAVGLMGLSFWLMRSKPVSAKELLQRTMQAESARFHQVAEPVLYRKLQVRRQTARSTDSVTWESWRNLNGDQFRQRVADQQGLRFLNANDRNTPPLLTEIEQILALNRLDAQRPLSAAAFDGWRTGLRTDRETVSESGPNWTLTIHVPAPYSIHAIRQASLFVRRNDWHAVALQLQVQGEGEIRFYELSETAYEVMPLEALTVFANLPMPLPLASATVSPAASPSVPTSSPTPAEIAALSLSASPPSAAALQEAEVATLYALHQVRADLGEQIEVTRENDRHIVVRGLVQNAARKAELLRALSSIALVNPQIQTVEEALQQVQQAAQPTAGTEPLAGTIEVGTTSSQPTTTANTFQQKLVEFFDEQKGAGRKGLSETAREDLNRKVTQFYSTVEADASATTAEAWALRRWQERLTAITATRIELSAVSRQQLEDMFKNHLARLRQRAQNLQTRWRPVLVALVGEPITVAPAAETTRSAKIQAVFRTVEQINHLSDQLIAGQGAMPLLPTAKALLTELAQLDSALKALEEH